MLNQNMTRNLSWNSLLAYKSLETELIWILRLLTALLKFFFLFFFRQSLLTLRLHYTFCVLEVTLNTWSPPLEGWDYKWVPSLPVCGLGLWGRALCTLSNEPCSHSHACWNFRKASWSKKKYFFTTFQRPNIKSTLTMKGNINQMCNLIMVKMLNSQDKKLWGGKMMNDDEICIMANSRSWQGRAQGGPGKPGTSKEGSQNNKSTSAGHKGQYEGVSATRGVIWAVIKNNN